MRLFAAVVLPDHVVEDLDAFLEPRREAGEGLRWTLPEHWHVTLAFLPSVADRHLDDLVERLVRAGRKRTAYDVRICGGGAFPNPSRGKVLYARLEGLDFARPAGDAGPVGDARPATDAITELARLATGARAAAGRAGTVVEGGRFRPHVTLARVHRPQELTNWVRLLDAYRGPAWTVDEFALVESHLGQGPGNRPRYEVLETFRIGPGHASETRNRGDTPGR